MFSITTSMTAQAPSRFGMPISGSAYDKCATGAVAPVTVVRDRHVTGADATLKGDFPGTSAWRPPIC